MKKYVVYLPCNDAYSPRQNLLTNQTLYDESWAHRKRIARRFTYNEALAIIKHMKAFWRSGAFDELTIVEVDE